MRPIILFGRLIISRPILFVLWLVVMFGTVGLFGYWAIVDWDGTLRSSAIPVLVGVGPSLVFLIVPARVSCWVRPGRVRQLFLPFRSVVVDPATVFETLHGVIFVRADGGRRVLLVMLPIQFWTNARRHTAAVERTVELLTVASCE